VELPLSAPPRPVAQGAPRQAADGQRSPARPLRDETETRGRVPPGDRRPDLSHLVADGDAAPRQPVRMAGRAPQGLPRAVGRLDRDPLRRQIAPRGATSLLSSLHSRLTGGDDMEIDRRTMLGAAVLPFAAGPIAAAAAADDWDRISREYDVTREVI